MLRIFAGLLAAAMVGCGDDDGDQNENPVDAATRDSAVVDAVPPDAATPDEVGQVTCASMCALLLTCPDVPDRDALFGTTQGACERACEEEVEQYLRDCVLDAGSCGELGECTRCLEWADVGFCRDSACDLLVNECGGSNLDQCYIDCEMYASGAAGCFRGAGRSCWVQAADAHDCAAAAICPTIH